MAFKAEEQTISKLLNSTIYEIPRNQRKYVWKEENWKDIFSDILIASNSNQAHFFGSFVLKEEDKVNSLEKFTVIDGQQRLTTITLLLASIMLHFRQQNLTSDFNGSVKFLKSTDTKNESRLVFKTEYHQSHSKILEAVLDESTRTDVSISAFASEYVINKRQDKVIGDCFKYFYNRIKERIEGRNTDKAKFLTSLRDAVISMTYISIVAASTEDSYTIFEILNARGQNLDDHELLRNYIMRYYAPKESIDTAKKTWDSLEDRLQTHIADFIYHYAIHRYTVDKNFQSNPYKRITEAVNSQAREISLEKDVKTLIEDLSRKADDYVFLVNSNDIEGVRRSYAELRAVAFFKSRRIKQIRPVMLSLMHQKSRELLSAKLYDETVLFLSNFLACFIMVGRVSTNNLSDILYKYASILENDFCEENLNIFLNSLRKKIPNEQWFLSLFSNIGYSKRGLNNDNKLKETVCTVLELYESHLEKSNNVQVFTIEHILPDSDSEDNSRIGNLLPLEAYLNEKCGDKPLSEKIEFYKCSTFLAVRNFVNRYENNLSEFNVKTRTSHLAKIFYKDILQLPSMCKS